MFEFGTTAPQHDPFGLYRKVLEVKALELAEKLCRRLIRVCMSQAVGFSGDRGLKNLWDEICVAFQTDSDLIDWYADHLHKTMSKLVSCLPKSDVQMLWLMSYEGCEYATSPSWPDPYQQLQDGVSIGTPPPMPWPSLSPDDWPIDINCLAQRLVSTFVIDECMNYENARIRKCLD